MVQWKTGIICLQSIYCKHWNNYIITVQHSPLLVQYTSASAWQARRSRGKKILSDARAATHAPPTEPHRRLVSTIETPFLSFSVHSYTCVRLIHMSPYWILIRRWISVGFAPSLNKNLTTLRCSCLVHCCKGTVICWTFSQVPMRAAGVPMPSIGSSRSPSSHTLHTMISVLHAIFNTTFPVFHWTVLVRGVTIKKPDCFYYSFPVTSMTKRRVGHWPVDFPLPSHRGSFTRIG